MDDRGDNRPTYKALIESKEWRALKPGARACWLPIKLLLGRYGIGILTVEQLVDPVGIPLGRCSEGVGDMIQKNWLFVEENVMWLRNGLRFEWWFRPEYQNHVAGAVKYMKTLPKLDIVRQFAEYYRLPNPWPPEPVPDISPKISGEESVTPIPKPKPIPEGIANASHSTGGPSSAGDPDNAAVAYLAHLMPILRECRFVTDDTAGSILKALHRKKLPALRVEQAVRGLAMLRDGGQMGNVTKSDTLGMRLLYSVKNRDRTPLWTTAENEYFRQQPKQAPVDTMEQIGRLLAQQTKNGGERR